MLLPTLYSRRSDGAVQTWVMEVEGNGYRSHSGIEGGSIVTGDWTYATPKNEGRANATTAEEQALLEAQSHWNKKKERKYSENLNSIDTDRIYQCQLAKEYKKEQKFVIEAFKKGKRVFQLPKLDGIRDVFIDGVSMTRQGKVHQAVPHINRLLVPFVDRFAVNNIDLIVDGELYADKYNNDFNDLCSIIRKGKPTQADIEKSEQEVQYHVYDLPCIEADFSERRAVLEQLVDVINHPSIVLVECVEVFSLDDIEANHERWLEAGYEGSMIRVDGPYENKRSKYLLKYKNFIEAEFLLDTFSEGVGKRAGMAARVTIRNLDGSIIYGENGQQAAANIIGDFTYCRQLLKDAPNLFGQIATLKFFRYGKTGAPYLPHLKAIRDYE